MSSPRRLVLVAAASVSVALALTACGRSDDAGSAQSAATISSGEADGTIEVWAMGTEGERLPELAKDFEAANPGVTVNVTPIPWESSTEKINTAMASGDVPDVIQAGTTLMSGFVDQDGLAATPDAIDPDAFFPGAWDTTVVGGTSYAVPWYVETRVLYYRTDLAAAAGLSAPTTWDELTAFAAGLQSAGAQYGIALQTQGNSTTIAVMPFFWQAGGDVMNADETEFTLGTPAQTDALTYYTSFIRDGVAPQVLDDKDKVQNFVDGKIGSFVAGPWERANIVTTAGDGFEDKFAVVPLPAGVESGSFIGGSNLAVTKDAKNPDAAWKFVQYATSPETQVEWFTISNDLPAVVASWDDPALADDPSVSVYKGALEAGRSTPAIPTWAEIEHELDLILEQVIAGKITPEDAAAQMQDAAATIGTGLD